MPQSPRPFRKRGATPLADLVTPLIGPVLARQGFGEADVLMHWAEIVGEHLAERCRPVKLQWRPRPADPSAAMEPATLIVRVEGAFALQLQHMAAVVLERVNAYFGWRCVGKLVLKQGPLPVAPPGKGQRLPPGPEAQARAEAVVGALSDGPLHDALVALGSRVFAR